MSQITIIGSGIAAIAAALEAERKGAQVTIIRGRPGSTALSSGAWDIAGNPLRHPDDSWHTPTSPRDNIQQLLKWNPHHPYAHLQRQVGDLASFLAQGIAMVTETLNYPLAGSLDQGFLALTPAGTLKLTGFVPKSGAAGNFLTLSSASLLIIGIKDLNTCHPKSAAKVLSRRSGLPVQTAEIEFPEPYGSPFELAQKIEGEWLELFCQKVAQHCQQYHPTHVILPPVIGLETTGQILARLHETTGIPCFETLSLPPSVPGLRLQKSIDRFLNSGADKNRKVMTGQVVGFEATTGRITKLHVHQGDQELQLATEQIILASGKYLSGGLRKEAGFIEPIFHLPITPSGPVFSGKVVEKKFLANHELFSVGIQTNDQLQPVDERNNIVYQNLRVAGSLLAGYNPAVDHSGMGVAVGSGLLAGRLA